MILTTSDGVNLFIKIHGDGDSSKAVLIAHHGAPGASSHHESEMSFKHLSHRFRVVVYDARGSGSSDRKGPFALQRWADDLEEIR